MKKCKTFLQPVYVCIYATVIEMSETIVASPFIVLSSDAKYPVDTSHNKFVKSKKKILK